MGLAETIAKCLGQKLGEITLGTFPDGETKVEIPEPIRGHDVFLIQVRLLLRPLFAYFPPSAWQMI